MADFTPEVECLSGTKYNIAKIPTATSTIRCQLTSGNVGSVTTSLDVVENVEVAVGMFMISYSVFEKHSTSGLESAIWKYVVG
jgi:hypothetical protein